MAFIGRGRKEETNKSYSYHQKLFKRWCEERKIRTRKPDEKVICRYLIYQHDSKKDNERWSASYFNTARTGIFDMYRYDGSKVKDSEMISDVMKSIVKRARPERQKEPLVVEHFERILMVLDTKKFTDVRDYHMMLMMYAMARRGAEIVKLRMSEVIADNEHKCLLITHRPAKQKRQKEIETVIAYADENVTTDVKRWHTVYTMMRKESKYYFHTVNGDKLSASSTRLAFKRLFEKAGMDFTGYGSQSARRGGTTALYQDGGNETMLKKHATWSGDTYLRYVKPSIEMRAKATKHLNANRRTDKRE